MNTMKRLKLQIDRVAMQHGFRYQSEITKATGINKNTMLQYWHNKPGRVDLGTLSEIADFIGCRPLDLFVEVDTDESEQVHSQQEEIAA